MDNKRIIFIIVAVIVSAIIGAVAAWLYFSWLGPQAKEEQVTGPLLIPQSAVSPLANPEWSFAGTIQKIDTANKFLDLKTAPLFPVSFAPMGFDDTIRIHFGDTIKVFSILVATENGVAVSLVQDTRKKYDLSAIHIGTPVRISGTNYAAGSKYLAKTIIIFNYRKQ